MNAVEFLKKQKRMCKSFDGKSCFDCRLFERCLATSDELDFDEKETEKQVKGEWIPCSERLPNKDGRYLVCTDWEQDNIEVIRWADGWNCFRDFDGNVYRKSELDRDIVIAWMPLPMPWEGGK